MSDSATSLTQQALLPIVLAYGVPFVVALTVVTFTLSSNGWSPSRLEATLAKSELSDSQYAWIAPTAVLLYHLLCSLPLVSLALMGVAIITSRSYMIGTCILLVGPSLLLLSWAAMRAKFCEWRISWGPIVAASTGAAGLLAAQLAFATVASTPFLSFSAVFLGLSAIPIALAGELSVYPGQPPLLSLRAIAALGSSKVADFGKMGEVSPISGNSPAAVHPIDQRRLLQIAGATYLTIMAAYAGVGAIRQDVAPYAAAAAAACVLVFDALAFALYLQGAVRGKSALIILCAVQRLIFVAFGPMYIDEGEAVVFLLTGLFATHRLIRWRWVRPPTTALDRYVAELCNDKDATADVVDTAHRRSRDLELFTATFALELFTAAVCVAHLLLLLLLVLLLPPEALPPARLLGSQHPQPLSGLLAFSLLACLAATDALLNHWLLRGRRPLLAWLAWWSLIVGVAALIDTLLVRSFGLLVFTAFAGPILLVGLYGHRAWAQDAYCFVSSWEEVKLAWSGPVSSIGTTEGGTKPVEADEDVETVSAAADPPPSPPPSPASSASPAPPATSASDVKPTAISDAANPSASLRSLRLWGRKLTKRGLDIMQRVQASTLLQRFLLSFTLALLHLGLGASLAVYLGSTGWAVAMGMSFAFLGGIALLSAYHQPERRVLPLVCIALVLLIHITFCVLFWLLVLTSGSSEPEQGDGSQLDEGSGETVAGLASAALTPGIELLLYAVGAPTAAALAGLGWLWYDAGWKLTRAVKLGMGTLGGLLLAFIVFLAIFYSWQVALGILIAAITLVVSSAAAVTWRANRGYLPRVWYISLGSLVALLVIVGAVVALISPSNDSLAAVNGFLGCSLSWWTILLVVWAAGYASGQAAKGESYRYYHCPTVVPSFRFMGYDQPLHRADLPIVLYSIAAIGAMAWSAVAAVTFQPAGLGACVGMATQLAWVSFMMHCAIAPLRQIGALAPFINTEVLTAAARAVSLQTELERGSGRADLRQPGASAVGVGSELDELSAARDAADVGLAAALAGRAAAQTKLGMFKACSRRTPRATPRATEREEAAGGALDVGGMEGRDVEQGVAGEEGRHNDRGNEVEKSGVCCCALEPEEAKSRRVAAGELPRLDDAVTAAWSANMKVVAKFHAALVSSATDAKAAHERAVRQFLRDTLRTREGGGRSDGTKAALDDDALDELLSVKRLRRLRPAQRAAVERAAATEQQRQKDESRRRELEALKQKALYAAQEQMRQLTGRREAMVRHLTTSWQEGVDEAMSSLKQTHAAISEQLPTAQAEADGVHAELEMLSSMGEKAACVEEAALAHATGGAAAELSATMAKAAALRDLADGLRSAEIFEQASEEKGEWAPETGAVQASVEHLPEELQADADVLEAYVELLSGAELCRRAEALGSDRLAAARAAMVAKMALLEEELKAVRTRLAETQTRLQNERVRLAKQGEAALQRRAEAEREALEARRREQEAELRRQREREAEEAEAGRKLKEEQERRHRRESFQQADSRTLRETAMVEEVEPRLASVRETGQPYTDRDFPPSGTRLLPPSVRGQMGVGWKRVQAIYGSRQTLTLFGADGKPDPDQICQGRAGDCWFLSALSILALRPDLVERIVVTPEVLPLQEGGRSSGSGGSSAGFFCVCFYKDGSWRPVVVDDYLPTNWMGNHLFARSRGNELWVSVLEKAYASLHGSYTAIEGGWIEDALCDLTGELPRRAVARPSPNPPPPLTCVIVRASPRCSA